MSKYVKLEDIEAVLADKHMNRPLDSDRCVIGDIGKSIADLPTIEVVRCIDCIDNMLNTDGVAESWCYKHGIDIEVDDFCSYGERIEESVAFCFQNMAIKGVVIQLHDNRTHQGANYRQVKNTDDSLFTEDTEMDKEQKSKLEAVKEYIPKDEVLDIIKSMPRDLVEEYIYMTKGIWLDDTETVDTPTNTPTDAPTEDCISRQAALAEIRTRLQDWAAYGNTEYRQGLYVCEDLLESLPPVEPKRPKGAWVIHELWDMPWCTCSECNFHGRNDYKFCPNCGCRMIGDDGNDNE